MSSPSDPPRGERTDGADEAPDGVLPGATGLRSTATTWRSRLPGAAYLRAHRRGLRRAAAAVVGATVAAAVLFVSGGSLPRDGGAGYADAPLRSYAGSPVAAVSGENITVDQVLGVLERAHQLAVQQGASMDPQVAQAAAELGMLYTTYRAQQEAIRAAAGVLDPRDGSVVGQTRGSDGTGVPGSAADIGQPGDGRTDKDPEGPEQASAEKNDRQKGKATDGRSADVESASEVSRVHELGDKPVDDLGGAGSGHLDAEAETHDHDLLVTRDDLVLAAQRLARLMDPSMADSLIVAPVPAGGGAGGAAGSGDPDLRENLVSIVDAFGLSTAGFANGRIPVEVLCPLEFAPGHRLRCDAAERLTALNEQYENRFGRSIPMTDSYRTYAAQVALRATKPALAAIPGTSNHGWGLAVDLGVPVNSGRSAEYAWLRVHGPDYGWDNPVWARLDGSKPEPWHFEFFAAGVIPNRALDVRDVGTGEDPRYLPPQKQKPGDEPDAIPAKNTKDKNSKDSSGDGRSGASDDPSKDPGDGSPPSSKPPEPKPKPSPSPSPSEKPSPSPSPSEKPSPSPSPSEPSPSPSPGGSEEPSGEPSGEPSESGDSGEACDEPAEEPVAGTDDGTGEESDLDSEESAEAEPCDSGSGDEPDASPSPSGTSDESSAQTDAMTGVIGSATTSTLARRREEDGPDADGEGADGEGVDTDA